MASQKICPKCRSKDVKFEWQTGIVGLAVADKFTCNKCGYSSAFFPEMEED